MTSNWAFALKSENERVLGFPVFGDGGMELRQPLQAGKLVQNEPYRSLIVLRRGQQPHNEQVDPKAMQRPQRLALGRAGGNKDPSFPSDGPLGCAPCLVLCLLLRRQHTKAVRNQPQRGQNAVALLLRSLGDHGLHLCSLYSFVDLRGLRQPFHELLRIRPVGQEMGKYLLRSFGKELALFVAGRLVQRSRDGLRFRLPAQLFGRSPIGAPLVQRVQHDVLALLVVEPLDELAGRVVDDGRMIPALNLTEDLHDECRLAGPGVAHEFDVLRFGLQRYPHHLFGLGSDEANAVAAHRLVELPRGEQDRAFEPTPVLQFLAAANVFADGERELREQRQEAKQ